MVLMPNLPAADDKTSAQRKNLPQCHFITDPTWTTLEFCLSFHGEMLAAPGKEMLCDPLIEVIKTTILCLFHSEEQSNPEFCRVQKL